MKLNMLTVVVLFAGCLLSQAAEYGYLSHTEGLEGNGLDDETITLNAGDRIEFLAASGGGFSGPSPYINVVLPDSNTVSWLLPKLTGFDTQNLRAEIVGPCVLQMDSNGASAYASYKITRAGTENSSSYITVPSNPSGNFELKLQTSTDLETWSSTTPGVFPYGDNAKFFRLVMETP